MISSDHATLRKPENRCCSAEKCHIQMNKHIIQQQNITHAFKTSNKSQHRKTILHIELVIIYWAWTLHCLTIRLVAQYAYPVIYVQIYMCVFTVLLVPHEGQTLRPSMLGHSYSLQDKIILKYLDTFTEIYIRNKCIAITLPTLVIRSHVVISVQGSLNYRACFQG